MSRSTLIGHLDDLDARVRLRFGEDPPAATHQFLDRQVTFLANDAAALSAFTDPLLHTRVEQAPGGPRAYVMTLDEIAGASLFRDGGLRTNTVDDGIGSIWFEPGSQSIRIADVARGSYYLIHRDSAYDHWRLPEHSRTFLELVLKEGGLVSLHGASVGDGVRGALIPGKGGSGKSTLVAQCIAAGYQTVGDDYLLYAPGAKPGDAGTLVSAFRTIKVGVDGSAADLLPSRPSVKTPDGTKYLVHPTDIWPESFVGTQTPVLVAVPEFGPAFEVSQANATEVLRALLPSSAAMSIQPGHMITELRRLVEQLPCFRMTLSPDFQRDQADLGDFLESFGISRPADPLG
jgi:hypothetical protein